MSAGGKGDKRRPQAVSEDEAEANWNRIFGRKPEPQPSNTEQDAKDGQLKSVG